MKTQRARSLPLLCARRRASASAPTTANAITRGDPVDAISKALADREVADQLVAFLTYGAAPS
ncbi:hypothetical protein [Sphingobium yanoikuyae]|uniref:hypothetical protein n=1 Tax=Sphingobium yanoikuyae TaxID=13690 RepID=UPI0024104959|nr:hypothetical protein [Sphingobium yanoikuyae]